MPLRWIYRRSQHMVLLLADWMSAIVLQAIFYGKSQFGVKEKARCCMPFRLLACICLHFLVHGEVFAAPPS